MLNWLRDLLGGPAPVHIHFDKGAVAVAKPGDVVILTASEVLGPQRRESVQQYLVAMQSANPEIKFTVLEPPLSGAVSKGGE